MSPADAKKAFANHLVELSTKQVTAIPMADLAARYLDWILANRSERSYQERTLHLKRFCSHTSGNAKLGNISALDITADDLVSFLKAPAGEKTLDAFSVGKHQTSVRAAFKWGVDHDVLPAGFNPFKSIERYVRPPESLNEQDLPTKVEVKAILGHADDDLSLVKSN